MKRTMSRVVNPRTMVVAVMVGAALSAFDASASAAIVGDKALQDINRYCTACWRNARLPADAWGDCTQEVFQRLLQRVPVQSWAQLLSADGDERREFVRAIDAVKKRTQRRKKYTVLNEDIAERTSEQAKIVENRELVSQIAQSVLSGRQQQIIRLSFEGYTVQDLAERLNMSPERVSDEKYKAIRKLRSHVHANV